MGGEYEFYAAVGLVDRPDPISVRSRLKLRGRYAVPRMMAYVATRASSALADPEEGGRPGPIRVRVLESFLDLYFEHVDVRIGHQLVVWGQMDGVFITDVVSPLDLTEFLAQDFTDIRLAVPALKVSYYIEAWSVTGLVVVSPSASPIPDVESPWFVVPETASSFDVSVEDDNLPDPGIKAVEPGLKVSYSGTGTSVDFVYLYGHNRIPAFAKFVTVTSGQRPQITVRPDYYRRHVIGSRLSSTVLSPMIVEAEVAYESLIMVDEDPSLLIRDGILTLPADDLLLRAGHLLGALSLARSYGETFIRTQLVGSLLTRYDDRTARERFQKSVTLFVKSSWDRERLGGQVFVYYNPGGDYWCNPALSYNASAGLTVFIGAHVFGGDPVSGTATTATFGQFDSNDFVYTRLTLAF